MSASGDQSNPSQRVLLRVKRGRQDPAAPSTVALPISRNADGAAQSVVVFDLVKGGGSAVDKAEALARQLDSLELEATAPRRPQPMPRAEVRRITRIVTSENRNVVLIDVAPTMPAPDDQQVDNDNVPFIGKAGNKRSNRNADRTADDRRDAAMTGDDDDVSNWALYEARKPASSVAPVPSVDDEWVRRKDRAQRLHLDMLENFSQRLDPSSLMREAWSILDVPLDSAFDVTESTAEMQRLVFDAGEYEYGLPDDDDGTFAMYRRARRHLFESRCAASLNARRDPLDLADDLLVVKGTAVEMAAYGGDDVDSNAEDNSQNDYPSTQEDLDEDDRSNKAMGSDDEERFRPKFTHRTYGGAKEDGVDDDEADEEDGERDSWGVGAGPSPYTLLAKAANSRKSVAQRHDDGWGDSDDDVRVARQRFDHCYGDDNSDGDAPAARPYRRHAGGPRDDDHEEFAPEIHFDPEGNAYW